MTQYIDKAAVVAEINKRIIDAPINNIGHQCVWAYNDVKNIIESLEVKEIDLEKEYDNEFFKDTVFCKLVNRNAGISIAKYFFELGMKLKNIQPENVIEIKWKPSTEIPTEHWENNPAISPLYLVKCGSVNGNSVLGYTHYSYVSNSWMDCFRATEDGVWNVLEWTDKRNI